MSAGNKILPVAEAHQGERYVLGARVPMDNAAFRGPWDCAEFVSWCINQTYGILFGVRPHDVKTADAYTGYWAEDALDEKATVEVGQALRTPGAILLRRPRAKSKKDHAIGHIAISRGDGSTIEARGRKFGVVIVPNAASRPWDMGVLVPGVEYVTGAAEPYIPPANLLLVSSPLTHGPVVAAVQNVLNARGYSPGPVDGIFGASTEAAVYNFQATEGIATDGVIGPETAGLLGLAWPLVPSPSDIVAYAAAQAREGARIEILSQGLSSTGNDADARPANAGAPQADLAESDVAAAAEGPLVAHGAGDITGFERTEPKPGRFEHHAKLADGSKIYLGSETRYTDDMPRRGLYQPAGHFKDIEPAGRYDRNAAMVLYGKMAQIIWPTVMAESNSYFARLNTYDRAAFTFGCYQAAAHTPNENLVVLFRMLLALPSATRFFPDLTLIKDENGTLRVHRKLSNGSTRSLETPRQVTRPNGVVETQIADFMTYLNADPGVVDDSERTATARLLLWLFDEQEAQNAQVRHAIATAKAKIKNTMQNVPAFNGDDWREVIWVNDIRHQGRGGFKAIASAYQHSNVLAQLAVIGAAKYPERIQTVQDCIQTLEAEGGLAGWSPGDLT